MPVWLGVRVRGWIAGEGVELGQKLVPGLSARQGRG